MIGRDSEPMNERESHRIIRESNWISTEVQQLYARIIDEVLTVKFHVNDSDSAYRVVRDISGSFTVERDNANRGTPELESTEVTFSFPDLVPAPNEIWISHGKNKLICREIPREQTT